MSRASFTNPVPTARFSDRASDYAAARPSYPAAAIEAIIEGLGESAVIADVGAGTGISSRMLAQRGVRVIAVEPNTPMREAGLADPHPRVEWRDGTAESTGLGDASVDAVVCAQAFHWFRADEALAEFARVLVPRGRVALMWNNRDERDSFSREYTEAVNRAAEASGHAVPYLDSSKPLHESRLFVDGRVLEFEYAQRLDEAGLIKRAASVSYVPKEGDVHDRLIAELRGLFTRHAEGDAHGEGKAVRLKYVTRAHLAQKA